MKIECQDGVERIGRIRGKIRKRKSSWINAGKYVIVAFREYQDEKCDIIEILSDDEVKRLKRMDEIVDQTIEEEDNGIEFETQEDVIEDINIDDI